MIDLVTKLATRIRSFVFAQLLARMHWLHVDDGSLALLPLGQGASALPRALIVSPSSLTVQRRQYPISSWWQTRRVLDLEFSARPNVFFTVGPYVGGSREVLVYELDIPNGIELSSVWFFLPESEAIRRAYPNEILEVHSSGPTYFLHPSGFSHVAAGLVSTASAFCISQGLDSSTTARILRGDDQIRDVITRGLQIVPLRDWCGFFRRQQWERAIRAVGRLAAVVLAVWCLFQVVTLVYLQSTVHIRQNKIASLGGEVSQLVARQRALEKSRVRVNEIADLLAQRELTVAIWQLDVPVRSQGGTTYGLSLRDGVTTLRGQAPNATELANQVAKIPGVTAVRIESTSMIGAGKEDFVVNAKVQFRGSEK
jgi:hypothetical protein